MGMIEGGRNSVHESSSFRRFKPKESDDVPDAWHTGGSNGFDGRAARAFKKKKLYAVGQKSCNGNFALRFLCTPLSLLLAAGEHAGRARPNASSLRSPRRLYSCRLYTIVQRLNMHGTAIQAFNMLASCCLRSYQSMYNHKEEVESKLQDSVSYYHALSFPWGYLYIWSTLSLFLVNITYVYLCSVMG